MDWAGIAQNAFIQGLAFVLALGFLYGIIAVAVGALAAVWRTITS